MSFWTAQGDHCRLAIRLTPNARHDRIEGLQMLADGRTVLAVRVRAIPEDGRANAALCQLLARTLDVPKSSVSVVGGTTQRLKAVRIEDHSPRIAEALHSLGKS